MSSYQTEISYTSSAISGGPQTSDFTYNAAGNLASVAIHDGTPSTIAYTTNAQGQILRRVETSSNSTNPKTFYYFFGGQQVGEVTNDGSEQVQDYAEAIAVRSAKAQEGPFANGGSGPTAYAAFGDAFQQITPTSHGASTGLLQSLSMAQITLRFSLRLDKKLSLSGNEM